MFVLDINMVILFAMVMCFRVVFCCQRSQEGFKKTTMIHMLETGYSLVFCDPSVITTLIFDTMHIQHCTMLYQTSDYIIVFPLYMCCVRSNLLVTVPWGLSISSLLVLKCSFHMEFKRVSINVGSTHGNTWGKYFCRNREPSMVVNLANLVRRYFWWLWFVEGNALQTWLDLSRLLFLFHLMWYLTRS